MAVNVELEYPSMESTEFLSEARTAPLQNKTLEFPPGTTDRNGLVQPIPKHKGSKAAVAINGFGPDKPSGTERRRLGDRGFYFEPRNGR